jgi:drug/metabolite transporter (DMT)-like permease
MISLFNFGCILASIVSCISYRIHIKQAQNRMFTCLFTFALCFLFFPLSFLVIKTINTGSLFLAILNLTTIITSNIVLYITVSLLRLTIAILFSYLLTTYKLSEVALVLTLGTPLYAVAYFILGNTPSFYAIIGILLTTLGSIIAGFKKFEFPNIFKPLLFIPISLYFSGILLSIAIMLIKVIVFIASQHTADTITLHHFINTNFIHFPLMHSHWENTLNFMVGVGPYIATSCIFYIFYKENFHLNKVRDNLKINLRSCLLASISLFASFASYFYVFQTISDKSILTALNQLTIPLTLIFSVIILKEKITLPQKIASVIIVSGGILSVL